MSCAIILDSFSIPAFGPGPRAVSRLIPQAPIANLFQGPTVVVVAEGGRLLADESSLMFQRLLVPLDGSLLAETALVHAEALARNFQSKILLLRVNNSTDLKGSTDPVTQQEPRLVYLESLARGLREGGVEVECRVQAGDPSSCIIELAESDAVDLVVMSSHGRTGLARWVYGSVAEKVLHNVRCPMMLVRNLLEES